MLMQIIQKSLLAILLLGISEILYKCPAYAESRTNYSHLLEVGMHPKQVSALIGPPLERDSSEFENHDIRRYHSNTLYFTAGRLTHWSIRPEFFRSATQTKNYQIAEGHRLRSREPKVAASAPIRARSEEYRRQVVSMLDEIMQ